MQANHADGTGQPRRVRVADDTTKCGDLRKLGNTLSVARFPYGILECAGISVIRMGKRRDADEGGNETHPNVP